MTSRRGDAYTRWNLDIGGALGNLDKLQQRIRGVQRRADNLTLGVPRRALGGGGTLLTAVGAGAGLGAGITIVEQFFEKLIELFEGTPILEQFTDAIDAIFMSAGPLIGVLLHSLLPVLTALTPAIEPLAQALAPLIELLGASLLTSVTLLTPVIIGLSKGLQVVTRGLRDGVFWILRQVLRLINLLPGVDIQLPDFSTDRFEESRRQLRAAQRERDAEEAEREAGRSSRRDAVSGLQNQRFRAEISSVDISSLERILVADNARLLNTIRTTLAPTPLPARTPTIRRRVDVRIPELRQFSQALDQRLQGMSRIQPLEAPDVTVNVPRAEPRVTVNVPLPDFDQFARLQERRQQAEGRARQAEIREQQVMQSQEAARLPRAQPINVDVSLDSVTVQKTNRVITRRQAELGSP